MLASDTRQLVANKNLLEYANKNRNEGFFNDITIIAGNETIQANRLVLSCYSSHFEGILKFFERYSKCENIIEMENVDGTTLKNLIDFIYTGFITINHQNVENLLSGAHHLQMLEVIQFCFEFLRSHVTAGTSLDTLKIADLYGNEALKEEMYQFFSINLDDVLQTNHFKAFSKEELTLFISNLDRNKAKESSVFQAIVAWIRHDEARITDFSELFRKLDLYQVPLDYLEEVILEEKLVTNVDDCRKAALSTFRKKVREQNANPQKSELLKENEVLQLFRLGGWNVSSKVTIVLNLIESKSLNYPDLPKQIRCHCSLVLDNYLYCIGGSNARGYERTSIDSVWKLNLKQLSSNWQQVASMKAKRSGMGAAAFGHVIVVAGGLGKREELLASTEVYQSALNEWRTASLLNQGRDGHALVSCERYLYVIGGWNKRPLSSVERLGDLKEEWMNITPMLTPRGWLAAVICNETIYAIGGQSENSIASTLSSVEKYDFADNRWKYVCNMKFKRRAHAACVLRNKIYVVGGVDANEKVVKEIECYDSTDNTWSIVGNATEELFDHTLLPVCQ